jgi:hypothetical protein
MSAAMRNADRSVREFRAMSLLSCNLTRELRTELDRHSAAIPGMKVRELRELTERSEGASQECRRRLGALAPGQRYLDLVAEMEGRSEEMLWMQKYVIDTQLFSNLAAAVPRWPLFPPHLRVGIDHHGKFPDGLEWRLLEASLFESVAVLWNDVRGATVDDSTARGDEKIAGKRYRELMRSTIRAIFAFLEGYLNGIAYDTVLTRDVTQLSKGAQELLSERDDEGRARFKTLREKLFGYPRLALDLEHSPLDTTNAHIAYILEHERALRDAIVHPTPRVSSGEGVLREQAYFEVDRSTVSALLDHSIHAVRYIDGVLGGRFGRVEIWLADREADGSFAPRVFH